MVARIRMGQEWAFPISFEVGERRIAAQFVFPYQVIAGMPCGRVATIIGAKDLITNQPIPREELTQLVHPKQLYEAIQLLFNDAENDDPPDPIAARILAEALASH